MEHRWLGTKARPTVITGHGVESADAIVIPKEYPAAIPEIDISPSTGSLPPRSRPPPQPHTSAAAVLINELDAGAFKGSSNDVKGGATRLTRPSL